MYLSDISKALPIRDNVSVITKYKYYSHLIGNWLQIRGQIICQRIHEMSGPTQAHLYVTQINSTRSHFIGTIELITCLEFLKTDLKLKF